MLPQGHRLQRSPKVPELLVRVVASRQACKLLVPTGPCVSEYAVLGHEGNQVLDRFHIERVGGLRRFVGCHKGALHCIAWDTGKGGSLPPRHAVRLSYGIHVVWQRGQSDWPIL